MVGKNWFLQPSTWIGFFEVFLIGLIFAAFCGTTPPEVNEAHYLTKAKHFWNPDFCPNDLFLTSSSPHWVFYVLCGWPTLFLSLESAAWLGRSLTWLLMAVAWQRLSWQITPRVWVAPITAILFFLLNDRFHLAGEWVVGGFEAKGIAYALVWFAIARILIQDWNRAWLLLGIGAAFHPLAGGWSFLACLGVRLVYWFQRGSVDLSSPTHQDSQIILESKKRFGLANESYWLGGGLMLAIAGAIPSVWADFGVDLELAFAAHWVHVHKRLSHHLLFGAFATDRIAMFTLMVVGWGLVFWIGFKNGDLREQWRRDVLFHLGIASLLISLMGLVLSAIAESKSQNHELATSLLRFYWFRLSDFMIPTTLALSMGCLIRRIFHQTAGRRAKLVYGFSILALVCAGMLLVLQKHHDLRPISDQRSLPKYDTQQKSYQAFLNWRKVCDWIARETPTDAVFITPADQQTFKWYAGRSEVANWKDTPQDALSVNQWYQRVTELIVPQREFELGLLSYSDDQIRELGRRYQADYLVVLQSHYDRSGTDLKRVYPQSSVAKTTYVVIYLGDR